MSSRYLDMVRGQRRARGFQFTAKTGLILIALIGMGASLAYWWGVQSELTSNRVVALAFTAILTLAPPSLTSFLIPWSPAGMLLQKVNAHLGLCRGDRLRAVPVLLLLSAPVQLVGRAAGGGRQQPDR